MNYDRPELLEHLAGQYALGTLGPGARRRFRRHLRHSPLARAAVAAWEARLADLAAPVPAIAPPDRVWQGIAARLPGPPAASPESRRGLPRWLAWAGPALGVAFGAVLGIGLVQQMPDRFVTLEQLAQREESLPQSYVGLLSSADGQPAVLASSTRHGRKLTVKVLRAIDVPPGQVLQLWGLPKDKAGTPLTPLLLGEIPSTKGSTSLTLPDRAERLLANVEQLGVTARAKAASADEARDDFLLKGHCVKLW